MQLAGQCSPPMADLGEPAARSSACLDDDRALALVDGQLSPRAREEVEAHLDACASCRRFVSELAKESLFESAKVAPTDLEKTGYAPGRPQLLDVALTARDLAATRIGVPDAPSHELRANEPRDAREATPRSVPPAPAADSQRPISLAAPAASSGLSRSHIVVLSIAVALAVLTGLAALISVGALGYTLLDP